MSNKYSSVGTHALSGCLRSATLIACLFSFAPQVFALESASYRLYDTFPNDGSPAPDASTNYRMNENGVTWRPFPLASTSYAIVPAPPVASSSASSSVASSVGSAASSIDSAHPAQGRRPRPPAPSRPAAPPVPAAGGRSSASSSAPATAVVPSDSAPAASSSASIAAAPVKDAPPTYEESAAHPSAPCADGRCRCERPWTFGGMCVGTAESTLPRLGMLIVILEALLLLRILRRRCSVGCRKQARSRPVPRRAR